VRVDLHLHSRYSHDSSTSLDALIKRARECGLDRIALTDEEIEELYRVTPDGTPIEIQP